MLTACTLLIRHASSSAGFQEWKFGLDDNQPTNARDAANEAGRPLQPLKRNAAEQKHQVDAALRLVHGASGDFDDANDTNDEPENSEDGLPELFDDSADFATGDALCVDESAAAPDLPDDLSGSSDAFPGPMADSVSDISSESDFPTESGGDTLSDDFASIQPASDGDGFDEQDSGADAPADEGDPADESVVRPNDLIKITIAPGEAPDEGPFADSPGERVAPRTGGSRPAPRVNYLPIPLEQQGGEGASTPRVFLEVTVQGAELVANEAIERVATRIDKLIEAKIDDND